MRLSPPPFDPPMVNPYFIARRFILIGCISFLGMLSPKIANNFYRRSCVSGTGAQILFWTILNFAKSFLRVGLEST